MIGYCLFMLCNFKGNNSWSCKLRNPMWFGSWNFVSTCNTEPVFINLHHAHGHNIRLQNHSEELDSINEHHKSYKLNSINYYMHSLKLLRWYLIFKSITRRHTHVLLVVSIADSRVFSESTLVFWSLEELEVVLIPTYINNPAYVIGRERYLVRVCCSLFVRCIAKGNVVIPLNTPPQF